MSDLYPLPDELAAAPRRVAVIGAERSSRIDIYRMLAMMGGITASHGNRPLYRAPRAPKIMTIHDHTRLDKAEAKRERKRINNIERELWQSERR
jgi:hypothetical protein